MELFRDCQCSDRMILVLICSNPPPRFNLTPPHSPPPSPQCFAVRSLGWLQVEEDDLSPGRSSLAVSNVIQQLTQCSSPEQRERQGAWGEVSGSSPGRHQSGTVGLL